MADNANATTEPTATEPILMAIAEEAAPILEAQPQMQESVLLPEAGSVLLPEAGSAILTEAGSAILPEAGSAILTEAGSAILTEDGSAILPEAGSAILPEAGSTQQIVTDVSQQPTQFIHVIHDNVPILRSHQQAAEQISEGKSETVPSELVPEVPTEDAPVLQSEASTDPPSESVQQVAQEIIQVETVEQVPMDAIQQEQKLPLQQEQPQPAVEPQPALETQASEGPQSAVETQAVDEETQAVDEKTQAIDEETQAIDEETQAIDEETQAIMPTLEPPPSVQAYNPQQAPPPISPPKITSYTAVHTTTGIMRYTPGIMSALAGKYSNSSQLVEQLVLNCAGCISLSDIRVLDMSSRKIMNLDPAVFSRMPDLEELDLSYNKIKGFDTQLGLRKLRYLNLKKNCLKSILTLEQFLNLEELNIEENDLSPPDQYIAVYLLPKLKKLNGKDVDIRDTIQTMEDTLKDKLKKIWDEEYAEKNKVPLNKTETKSLETEFVQRLKESIQYGPNTLVDFTHHMLSVLAEKHVAAETACWRKTVPELIQSSDKTQSPSNKVSIKRASKDEMSSEAKSPADETNSLAASLEAAVKEVETQKPGDKEVPMDTDPGEESKESRVTPKKTPPPAQTGSKSPAQTGSKSPAQTGSKSPAQSGSKSPAQSLTKSPAPAAPKSPLQTPPKSPLQTPPKTPIKVIVVKRHAPGSASTTNGEKLTPKKAEEPSSSELEEPPVKRRRSRAGGAVGKCIKKEKTDNDSKPKTLPQKVAKAPAINTLVKKEKKVSSGYEITHMLRCHSMEDDPADAKTNVWKCAFEPSLEKPGTSKWTVASCGGNAVCITDCSTGKVLKKYQHAKDKEEFYCVAWTTIPVETGGSDSSMCNILAVAGTRGSVKLLHTNQLLCYSEIKGDRRPRPINSLLFHPENPTWLLCGSEDIIIWDIGTPEGSDYKCKTKKLYHLAAPGRVLGLVALPSTDFILAGCENGCYGWRMDSKQPVGKKGRAHCVEFLLPSKARLAEAIKGDDDDEAGEGDMIDGLALLNDKLVASKVACDGAIHIWNLADTIKKKPTVKEISITPQSTMQWCDSDSVYLDIGTWQGCGSLVSGDDEGKIWVYDITKIPLHPVKSPATRKPSHLLYWPDEQPNDNSSTSSNDHIIINDVAISSDCKYIVSVTNRNVICIWRKL